MIRDCDGNRAPGPDGLNINFFKQFWPTVKGDILRFLADYHSSGKIVRGLNAAFIALIPKHISPQYISDF